MENVRLTVTPNKHDGEWLRVRQFGYFEAGVRSVADLERWSPPAELEPDGPLVLAA